jgi:hypothetical protein
VEKKTNGFGYVQKNKKKISTFVSMICVDQSMTVVNPLIISKRDLKMSQIPKFRKFGRHI